MTVPASATRHPALIWAGILACGLLVRIAPWREVFSPDRVRFLVDTDPHYHVLRALRILEEFPQIPWTDPMINHPWGAPILWPPLFDLLIALPARLLGGSPAAVEQVAAWVPVMLGSAALVLVGALGRFFGGARSGVTAAGLLAFLPANVEYTMLGRPDQHAMELVVSCWIILAFLHTWRRRAGWGWSVILALGIAAAFWNWQGSAFYLLMLAGFAALWHIVRPAENKDVHPALFLARGAAIATALLGLSVALFTPGGLGVTEMMGVTGFHVILAALTAVFGWLLIFLERATRRRDWWWRLMEVGAAAGLPLAAALALVPGFHESTMRGLTALAASNPWYATINEFAPLLLTGWQPLTTEIASIFDYFGLLLIVLPFCVPALIRPWRQQTDHGAEMFFLLYWGILLLLLTAVRVRFNLYAVIPACLWLSMGLERCGHWARSTTNLRLPGASFYLTPLALLIVLLPALPFLTPGTYREAADVTASMPLLVWLQGRAAAQPERQGVMASWTMGHAIRYFARKPVITTPFGTDGGSGAMEDAAGFYLTDDAAGAEAVLTRRQAGFVLLSNPVNEVFLLSHFIRLSGQRPVTLERDLWNGGRLEVGTNFWGLVASRLYFTDGSGRAADAVPGLGGYRLLSETPSSRDTSPVSEKQMKLFGIVAGAAVIVENVEPGAAVVATVPVMTNHGRVFIWTTAARADAAGRAKLRISYATGPNGQTRASRCSVSAGGRAVDISLSESDVIDGKTVVVDLSRGTFITAASEIDRRGSQSKQRLRWSVKRLP